MESSTSMRPSIQAALEQKGVTIGKPIGKGGFGYVYSGVYQEKQVVIKTLEQGNCQAAIQEYNMLQESQPIGPKPYLCVCTDDSYPALVIELVPGEQVFSVVQNKQLDIARSVEEQTAKIVKALSEN
jgi:serine/threonine protein kinase